jgi:hypothetical protein
MWCCWCCPPCGSSPSAMAPTKHALVVQQQQRLVAAGLSLSDILKPDDLAPLLQSEGVYDRLVEHLPEPDRNPLAMHELARSVHLQTQVRLLSVSAYWGIL